MNLSTSSEVKKLLENDTIAMGWSKAKNLNVSSSWQDIKIELKKSYGYYGGKLGQSAGNLDRFIREMKVGDWVLLPIGGGVAIAEVTGDARHIDEAVGVDLAWQRTIRWIVKNPKPRNFASNLLQRRLKARQTCVSATDLVHDIQKFSETENKPSLENDLRESMRVTLSESLFKTLNDLDFEKFFVKMLRRTGADVEHLPKNDSRPGDADVKAVFQTACPAKIETTIYYQLKQHEGTLRKDAITQLIDRKNSFSEGEQETLELCVVTTAKNCGASVQAYADTNNVKVILKDELIEWLLDVDLNLLVKMVE